ncbi:hypothetical protein [Psychrobacillus sp.]
MGITNDGVLQLRLDNEEVREIYFAAINFT